LCESGIEASFVQRRSSVRSSGGKCHWEEKHIPRRGGGYWRVRKPVRCSGTQPVGTPRDFPGGGFHRPGQSWFGGGGGGLSFPSF
jgi:hypothetical protein